MNADGTNRVRLTTMRGSAISGGAISPSWSPDGRKIAFSAVSDSSTRDLYVIDVDGTHLAALTNDWVQDLDPAWSPDGSRIAFVGLVDYGLGDFESSLYLVNPDGTNLKWFGTFNPKEPAWTPDGRYIAFLKGVKGEAQIPRKDRQWQLWRVPAEGGEPQRLGLNVVGQLTGELRLHPDGRRVAIDDIRVNLEVWVVENFLAPLKVAK
jgi:Tol biopolymer transport system component